MADQCPPLARLENGMLIKTNYSGPYRIVKIYRNCTCPFYLDWIEQGYPPPTAPHLHLVCSKPDGNGTYYLSHWDENTFRSLGKSYCGMKTELDYDYIEVLTPDRPIQLTMFEIDAEANP